jgi:hypothetical protein
MPPGQTTGHRQRDRRATRWRIAGQDEYGLAQAEKDANDVKDRADNAGGQVSRCAVRYPWQHLQCRAPEIKCGSELCSGIHSNDLTGRSLRLDFLTHLPDGEYVLDDINAYVGYSEGYEFAATGLSGLIKINLLEGRYEGNYTVTVEDQHTRKWKMEGTIDIQVIPQRKN